MGKKILGVSALFHDAAVAMLDDDQIVFAGHSERYGPKVKLDKHLNKELIRDCVKNYGIPTEVAWYEKPFAKKQRQIYAGEWKQVFSSNSPKAYLKPYMNGAIGGIPSFRAPLSTFEHHYSHACAGYYTSPFRDATIVVIDAIGEWDTLTIWEAKDQKITKLHSTKYPHSLGLLYTAFTDHIGLKPLHEEYITMGMAAYGQPIYYEQIKNEFIQEMGNGAFKLKHNVHKGLAFKPKIKDDMPPEYDIACSIQSLTEDIVHNVMRYAQRISKSKNLVYMGGVALNCKANSTISHMWDDVWIMPSPGDSGNALGAALAKRNEWVEWKTPFLGYNIDRPYPVKQIITELKNTKICGVANGRAEFGPRALGHRSLLADPRGPSIKDKVNAIKKRQKFRPFAPAILEEHVHDYFDMPKGIDISPYMQFTATCKKPHLFPAIVHYDKSSRVQTVGKNDSTGFRKLLEAWYKDTGCPMLLNTSLNIRGKPMVNDEKDAKDWEDEYRVKVY